MPKRPYWLLCLIWLLVGCRFSSAAAPPPTPATIPVTNDAGETLATQPGPLWVLLSGVDEHGLIAEHELTLLSEPVSTAVSDTRIHTGTAVAILEIRQTGPQNLRRFYYVQSLSGKSGWISDFYVRRVAYLFNPQGTTVPLYAMPGKTTLGQVDNVTPVTIKEPSQPDWWIVQTMDEQLTGWVQAGYVKESSEPEFLLNQQHEH